MVVVMHIPLMVVVMVDDHSPGGARFAMRLMLMSVMMPMRVAMAMTMVMIVLVMMVMIMLVFMVVLMVVILAGNSRLAASAYATHINLPRCR